MAEEYPEVAHSVMPPQQLLLPPLLQQGTLEGAQVQAQMVRGERRLQLLPHRQQQQPGAVAMCVALPRHLQLVVLLWLWLPKGALLQ